MITEKEEKIIQNLEKKYDMFTHMTPSYGRDIGCIAVKRMISITRYGDVMPCPYMHFSLGNVLNEPLKDIIERGLNIKYFSYDTKGLC
jgi:MoaA/NifB/PqqE/SkfB family radical SAM enzyme